MDMAQFFKDRYPAGIPAEVDTNQYTDMLDVFEQSVKKFADKPAFSGVGVTLTFADMDRLTRDFAAYLQNNTNLKPGDRIALQMPNIPQYPVMVYGAMRAGLVVVNTNPLYTTREMEHQFNDSGAKALVVLANMAYNVEKVLPNTGLEHVFVTEIADFHKPLKRLLMNTVVKHVKKMVPAYNLPDAIPLTQVLKEGANQQHQKVTVQPDDIAVLQYTGGTTGVAKGAMLTHRNLVSNLLQCKPLLLAELKEGQETIIAPLPLYHIYSFTMNCGLLMATGNHSVLIPNPRDIPGFVKELQNWKFTCFMGLNTLFVALCNNEDFRKLDFSHLKITVAGGMALTTSTAKLWQDVTGGQVTEGYGLTETSPVATLNPPMGIQIGTIGMPLPSTLLKTIDDDGKDQAIGEAGELCIKGPQVMKGYWQRPEETAKSIDEDGWFKTGDVAVIQEDGYVRIVDRKKDMILVSGFNVYPNEIEDVVTGHPKILECAAVGIPDEKSGEAVKVYAVASDPSVTEKEIRDFCRENMTAYKVPKTVEFRDDLPKTNVGKILRRELRDEKKPA
ncbi:MAG: long-chain fatty acid--CoA ligase [Halomonadaceae bacterium]|nr:MAG: long-chain fatty acid--CoA ligase [Halomonadaceae bacterium]